MSAQNTPKNKYFCIFDYFLDGTFLKWEEIEGECPILIRGEKLIINLEDGTKINAKIVETEFVSEDERRILLSSC